MPGARRRRSTKVADFTRPRTQSAPPGRPERYWGWHRLRADWAARLVSDSDLGPGDLVLDLGAGDGALTAPLARTGADVIAVELHPARVRRLRRRFADCRQVRVLELDLLDLRLPSRPFTVLANPPWSLAKPLIRALTAPGSRLRRAELVLQRGLVTDLDRRDPPTTGRLPRFRTDLLRTVPRHAFDPAPPGPAAVLGVTRSRS